jgi:hypothetical protein
MKKEHTNGPGNASCVSWEFLPESHVVVVIVVCRPRHLLLLLSSLKFVVIVIVERLSVDVVVTWSCASGFIIFYFLLVIGDTRKPVTGVGVWQGYEYWYPYLYPSIPVAKTRTGLRTPEAH